MPTKHPADAHMGAAIGTILLGVVLAAGIASWDRTGAPHDPGPQSTVSPYNCLATGKCLAPAPYRQPTWIHPGVRKPDPKWVVNYEVPQYEPARPR